MSSGNLFFFLILIKEDELLLFLIRDPTFQSLQKIINSQYFYPTERTQNQQILIAGNQAVCPYHNRSNHLPWVANAATKTLVSKKTRTYTALKISSSL